MKNLRKNLLSRTALGAAVLGAALVSQAQTASANEFYFQINPNFDTSSTEQLFIFGEAGATGTISGDGYTEDFTLGAEGFSVITIPKAFVLTSGSAENKGLKVTSDTDISGYFLNRRPQSTDMTYLIDSRSLGTDYFTLGYQAGFGVAEQISVQATEDNTTVTFAPVGGASFDITLNAGQTYMYTASTELTGSRVTSNLPVAVFTGNQCTNVPAGFSACDHIVEQLPSVDNYSMNYIVAQSPRSGTLGNVYRIVASEDGTNLSINGAVVATLDAGQFYDTRFPGGAQIESDKPVLVGQYLVGSDAANGANTDPALALVPGVDDWLDSYVFATPSGSADFASDFVTIVMGADDVGTLTIDGATPDLTLFAPIGTTGYSSAIYDVSSLLGAIRISAAEKFLLMIYGFDSYDSYATYGGAGFSPGASGGGDFEPGDIPDIDLAGPYTTTQLAANQVNPRFVGGTLIASTAGTVANNFAVETQGGTIDTNGNNVLFSGVFSGPGGLTKAGLGSLMLGGTSTIGGDFNVNGGSLINLGSFTAATFRVGNGGTLGGAGSTIGNVVVGNGGTILGGMNITGDVSLLAGSHTIYGERISVVGGMTIASGATAQVNGAPGMPGSVRLLITTTEGLSGSYSTVSRPGNWGHLRQTPNNLELIGLFRLRQPANPQVVLTTDHLNSLFIAGTATPGILAGVPGLVGSDGYGNQYALGTLHPEAYGSAAQIGMESGLAIRTAMRAANFAGIGEEGGIFTFAQALGQWRRFGADQTTGTGRGSLDSVGLLGGIGYNSGSFMINAFIGTMDGGQRISPIGAKTDTSGTFFGSSVQYANNGLVVGGTVIMDRSNAKTARTLFNGSTARDKYRLRSTTIDGYVRYGFEIGTAGWRVGPQVGFTHIITKRGDVAETGGGAFSLLVDGQKYKSTFFTGDLVITNDSGRVRPWLSVGATHLLDSDPVTATARFVGVPSSFTVWGSERDKTFATVNGGFDYQLTDAVSFYVHGGTEIRSGNGSENLTTGVRIRF